MDRFAFKLHSRATMSEGAAPSCKDKDQLCWWDLACLDPKDPDYGGGKFCNAGGVGMGCRFCCTPTYKACCPSSK